MVHTSKEQTSSVAVTSNALKESEGITNTVACGGGQLTGVEEGVDADDLLEETGHDTWLMSQ